MLFTKLKKGVMGKQAKLQDNFNKEPQYVGNLEFILLVLMGTACSGLLVYGYFVLPTITDVLISASFLACLVVPVFWISLRIKKSQFEEPKIQELAFVEESKIKETAFIDEAEFQEPAYVEDAKIQETAFIDESETIEYDSPFYAELSPSEPDSMIH